MDAFVDLWRVGTWWVVFLVSAAVGLAGATGLLDRLEAPLERRDAG